MALGKIGDAASLALIPTELGKLPDDQYGVVVSRPLYSRAITNLETRLGASGNSK